MDLNKMTKTKLLEMCKNLGIVKCSSKNKKQLIEMLGTKNNVEEKLETGAILLLFDLLKLYL